MSESIEELPPRWRSGYQVIPLMPARDAWVLWPHDPDKITGPVSAVAVAYPFDTAEWDARVRDPRGEAEHGRVVHPGQVGAEGPLTQALHFAELFILVLADDFGDWETPFIDQRSVFFSEAGARKALTDRRVRAADAATREAKGP